MPLSVVNLTSVANEISQPFALRTVAQIGHLLMHVFICQGQMEWHKHLDEDELFLVHEGVIGLDTDRGNVSLHAEELVVVPKGVMHRSKSALRSAVALIRPALFTERTNGQRRFYTTSDDPPLEKVRLARVRAATAEPYRLTALAQVEDFEVLLTTGRGPGPQETAPSYGALWWAVRGEARVETSAGETATLNAGELTALPAGTNYRLSARETALLLTMGRKTGG
jgi:mannose-6-phosphate isomerase-like protein (cupin superfamily)